MSNAGDKSGPNPKARAFEHLVQEEPPAPGPARAGRRGSPPGRAAAPGRNPGPAEDQTSAMVEQLARRVDRLAEMVSALPQRADDDRGAEALSEEMKTALAVLRQQMQADLAKVSQRAATDADALRTELQAALAVVSDVPLGEKEERQATLAATSERMQALLAQERKAFESHVDAALAEQAERMQADLVAERRALRSELQAVVTRLADQAAEDRKERRGELHSAVVTSTERLRSVLVDERKELRGELQIVLPDVLRHRAEEWQQLRAALDASLNESGGNTLHALSQFGQQLAEFRRELTAAMAKSEDRRLEEREQLLADLSSALATTSQQLADDQRRLRGALDAFLAQAKNERLAFEMSVGQSGERTGEILAELSQRMVEMRRELSGITDRLSAQQADEAARLRADFRTGLVNSHNQLASHQQELHRTLDSKLAKEREARVREGMKQAADVRAAVEEMGRVVAEERRELKAAVAAAVEAANQWFTDLRDHLYERLETVIDVTAQSSASAASAVKALRRELKSMEADPRLLEALAKLGEEIERLEQKIPARVALRLPDSQLAAIVDAVRAPRGRPVPAVPKKVAKKQAPRAAKRVSGAALPAPPATEPGVRAW